MPDQFYALTPGEFMELVDGYNWREKREREKSAWVASIVANAKFYKRPTSMRKLLGGADRSPVKMTPEERRQEWQALMDMFPAENPAKGG